MIYLKFMKESKNILIMKRIIVILMALMPIFTSCEKEIEIRCSEIDMSQEKDDAFYTYFRFVNETDVPIVIEYLMHHIDIFTIYDIAPYSDVVDILPYKSQTEFVHFKDVFNPRITVYYNLSDGNTDNYTKVHYDEEIVYDDNRWSDNLVDHNSMVRTFVITQKMYNDAKK